MDDLLGEYKELQGKLVEHERIVVQLKTERSSVVKALYERDGKGAVYDLDGMPMIIVTSKTGTAFFTPRDKKKRGKKRAIVDGQVVELEDGQKPPDPPRRVEAKATLKASSEASTRPPKAKEPTAKAPAEPKAELDPLEAALAELESLATRLAVVKSPNTRS